MLDGENTLGIKIPYILLTNGGGVSEEAKAEQLTSIIGHEINPQRVILAHTVLKSLAGKYVNEPILVLGGENDEVYTSLDVLAWNSAAWPFYRLNADERRTAKVVDFSKINLRAALVFHDPRHWSVDIQLICDMILSGGVIGGRHTNPRGLHAEDGIELVFCNPDLLWRSDFPQTRLGQGAFKDAFQSVFKSLTGTTYPFLQLGKPTKPTYDYAKTTLLRLLQKEHPGSASTPQVYMVGDNPESDIAGANQAGWKSILVRTGVYDPSNGPPSHTPTHEVEDVEDADGHIDLPILVRELYANNASAFDLRKEMPAHVDIPRLRKGQVGGFFWSAYVGCADPELEGDDFLNSTWRVRDTLEQIDIAKLLIDRYPNTFELSLTSKDVKSTISRGKIASLIGIEGAHQLGNSIAALRQFQALGVRYVTLTHVCHNAFADSCGMEPGKVPKWGGLSPLGVSLVGEMNRVGVLVDLSHTSDDTARQALRVSQAPVIWSHSSARAIHDVPRNVPDDILAMVGTETNKTDAVVMVNFAPFFVAAPGNATIVSVADHVDHIAKIAGKQHVGIGSDFDGIGDVPVGLEDVSKYPALIAELYKRGWTRFELAGLTGRNLLRIMDGAERVAKELQQLGTEPSYALYDKRPDIPRRRAEF
ncbi:hypothetical protein EUX98_g7513 [Antrodiella citrinella]|uniref:Dipeptidase n=1 Tax=Antrodiella citrinella TaxID=2447956 RepID=A0A4S4MLN3_9APHY|nr:hypothetical protein EUX98_g7513 [Antrodiella citrinella]